MNQCRTWEKAREKHACYQQRDPSKTVLYRIVSSGRDELPRVWSDRFQAEYGVLRDEVLETLDQYLNCGILEHGAARVYCDCCKHSFLVGFSCKGRNFCPSCSAKRAVKFAEHLHDEVLEKVAQRHIVCSIPKRLRLFFRYDRRNNDILFDAAWGSIKEHLVIGGTPGLVQNLQTSGEALNHNPHLHGILSDGIFKPDGAFEPFGIIDTDKLTAGFAKRVLSALQAKGLLEAEAVEQILAQDHTGFSMWVGDAFEDKERELFVARYIERGPISLEKLSLEHDIVTYTTKDGVAHEFDALEYLALLTSHIPNRGESLTRFYGHYSSRSRGERAKQEKLKTAAVQPEELTQPIAEPKKKPSLSWSECMKRIYEIDPLECPRCKSQMRIIAFIRDNKEIEKIMDSMGIPKAQAPPPIPKYIEPESFDVGPEYPMADF